MPFINKVAWLLIAITIPAPVASYARDDVSVSLSVQEVTIQDTVALKLSSKSQWAFVAVDLETGKDLINTGSGGQRQLIPGSLMKLFITAAVLEQDRRGAIDLGTRVAVNGKVTKDRLDGDIIVKGAGNAFLTTRDQLEAIEKVKSLGVKEISGNVIIDDSLFEVRGWKPRYTGPAYGVPSALGLDMHTVSIAADPATEKVIVEPPNESVRVSFNPVGDPGIRQIDDLTYEITGWKPDAPVLHKRFVLADPGLYAGQTLLTLIKKSGIRVSGSVKRLSPSFPPEDKGGEWTKEIARIGSLDISEFIRNTNQQSLNVAADNLLFLLGAETYGAPGTREKGIQAVKSFLTELGVSLTGMAMDDGSGVSDQNRVSAGQMAGFLRQAAKRPWFPAFFDSLERPGLDGRLKGFGYKSERIRAKAGQLPEAFGLAGYVEKADGKKMAFAFIVTGAGLDISQAAPAAAAEALRILESRN